jgi:hypothetical protein
MGALLALAACSGEVDPISATTPFMAIPTAMLPVAAVPRVQLASLPAVASDAGSWDTTDAALSGKTDAALSGTRHVTRIVRTVPVLHDRVGGLCPWSHSRPSTALLYRAPLSRGRPLY